VLVSNRCTVPKPWTKEETLLEGCSHFCAAPDKNGILHVIAEDRDARLLYFLLEEIDTREISFFIQSADGPFALVFTATGDGYFVCAAGESKLATAVFTPENGWSKGILSVGTAPAPYCLAADKMSGVHMVVFDRGERSLSYISCDSGFTSVRSSFLLDTALEIPSHTALWLDARQNIYTGWYNGGLVHCRTKKAGGWPSGGWQTGKDFLLDEVPCLMSFYSGENLSLWVKQNGGRIYVYDIFSAADQSVQLPEDKIQPVRVNAAGQICIDFANKGIPEKWFFKETPIHETNQQDTATSQDEQDNQLLVHARRLMAEKKQLETELNKKEKSLSQHRQMLEMAQEHRNKQSLVLHEQLTLLDNKVKELREEINTKNKKLLIKEEEIKEERDHFLEAKKKLESYTVLYEESLDKISSLQGQLTSAESKERELLKKNKELQEELAQKKNVWESIGYIFHKRPSMKK
jgi:hypothetical protein